MGRIAIKLSKAEVDILLNDQGVTLEQPFVEGRSFRAAFKDSQGLPFFSTVSDLLSQPKKNYASGASATWLKEKQKWLKEERQFKVRITEQESIIAVLKQKVVELSAVNETAIDSLIEIHLSLIHI